LECTQSAVSGFSTLNTCGRCTACLAGGKQRGNCSTGRCSTSLLLQRELPASAVKTFRAEALTLASPMQTALEADGALKAGLPASQCE